MVDPRFQNVKNPVRDRRTLAVFALNLFSDFLPPSSPPPVSWPFLPFLRLLASTFSPGTTA